MEEVAGLRKFELYQTFYRRLKGHVVPLAVSAEERKRLMLRLSQLIGTTRYECFDAMVELIIAHFQAQRRDEKPDAR